MSSSSTTRTFSQCFTRLEYMATGRRVSIGAAGPGTNAANHEEHEGKRRNDFKDDKEARKPGGGNGGFKVQARRAV